MDADLIARDNHAFFCAAVAPRMCGSDFGSAALHSFDAPAQLGIETVTFFGYVRIDSADIERNCSRGGFSDAVYRGVFGDVAIRLPRAITGELNTEAEVIVDCFRFNFRISRYERDFDHGFEIVENPLFLPKNESLGRFVDLKITLVQ